MAFRAFLRYRHEVYVLFWPLLAWRLLRIQAWMDGEIARRGVAGLRILVGVSPFGQVHILLVPDAPGPDDPLADLSPFALSAGLDLAVLEAAPAPCLMRRHLPARGQPAPQPVFLNSS